MTGISRCAKVMSANGRNFEFGRRAFLELVVKSFSRIFFFSKYEENFQGYWIYLKKRTTRFGKIFFIIENVSPSLNE